MRRTIIILLACHISVVGYAQKIKADILLDDGFLKEFEINEKFINSIEYTSSRDFLMLSSSNQFYILGIGGMAPIFDKWSSKTGIESFTVTADGILMIISGNVLYQASTKPAFTKIMNIPDRDMGVSSKYKDVYVYDRIQKSNKNEYSIYQISRDRRITPVVKIPTPILSIFEQPSQLIFSTKNILFSVDIKTKKLYQILALPQEDDIISIVGDTIHHALYFSTNKAVYRVRNNKIELLNDEFGGILKYDGEGLLIFSPEENFIIRFRNNVLYDIPQNSSTIKTTTNAPQSKKLNGQQKITFEETTFLLTTSDERFEAVKGDIFEGEMKNGKVVQGKVIRNGKTVKLFLDKRNN